MKTLIRSLSMFGAILVLAACGEGGGGGDGAGSAATPILTPVFARYAYAANSFNGVKRQHGLAAHDQREQQRKKYLSKNPIRIQSEPTPVVLSARRENTRRKQNSHNAFHPPGGHHEQLHHTNLPAGKRATPFRYRHCRAGRRRGEKAVQERGRALGNSERHGADAEGEEPRKGEWGRGAMKDKRKAMRDSRRQEMVNF